MQKIVVLVGIAAAIALGVWSVSTVANPKVGASIAPHERVGRAVAASTVIAPHEIMVKLDRRLTAEYWAHPF